MRTHTHTLRSASTAIAAVLALGSTPLLAQAVSPTGDPIILAPAPAAAPPVVEVAPPVTTTAPVVQSLPDTYVPAKAAAPAVTPSAAPATTTASRAAAPAKAPVARTAAAPLAAAPVTTTAVADTAPAVAPVTPTASDAQLFPPSEMAKEPVVTTPKPAADAVDGFTIVTGVLGGLALIGFGWFGVTLARRRKTRKAVAVAPQITRPVVAQRPEPVVATKATAAQAQPEATISDPTPVMADPQAIPEPVNTPQPIRKDMGEIPAIARAENAFGAGHARWADDARPRQSQSPVKGMLASNGASVDLPAKRPESYEEREALFKRMVEAKPDKANPFTDRRSRMKRARLIVASLDQDFADRDPWIDLSQYPNNWPELAKRRFPQAA